jgi:hypothetical protein
MLASPTAVFHCKGKMNEQGTGQKKKGPVLGIENVNACNFSLA